MVEYSRFKEVTKSDEKIKWIEVVSLEQLDPFNFFNNQITPNVYYASPKIDQNCNKSLKTPLASFHDFMRIILKSVVPNTNEYLGNLSKKITNYDEIVELVMVSMAVVISSGKFEHFHKSVGNLRQFLKTEHGISPKWPGSNRLQELRNYLRSYGEHEDDQIPGKMARKVENIIQGWDKFC